MMTFNVVEHPKKVVPVITYTIAAINSRDFTCLFLKFSFLRIKKTNLAYRVTEKSYNAENFPGVKIPSVTKH